MAEAATPQSGNTPPPSEDHLLDMLRNSTESELVKIVLDKKKRDWLVPLLMLALKHRMSVSTRTIISEWPENEIRRGDPKIKYNVCWEDIYQGVVQRRSTCKMTHLCLLNCDELHSPVTDEVGTFLKKLLMLPIISIPLRERTEHKDQTVAKLAKAVFKKLGGILPDEQTAGGKAKKSLIDAAFMEWVKGKLFKLFRDVEDKSIQHLGGLENVKLRICLPSLPVEFRSPMWDGYMLVDALRDETLVQVKVSDIVPTWCQTGTVNWNLKDLRSKIVQESETLRSQPSGHSNELKTLMANYVKGHILWGREPKRLTLKNTGPRLVIDLLESLKGFEQVESLDLTAAIPSLQEGETSQWRKQQNKICHMFSGMPNLKSLNLSYDEVHGFLGEILEKLPGQLSSLELKGCDLSHADLQSLVQSKHAASLENLDLEDVAFGVEETLTTRPPRQKVRVMESSLVDGLESFPALQNLNITGTCVDQDQFDPFCKLLSNHLPELKELRMFMAWTPDDPRPTEPDSESSLVRLRKACARIPFLEVTVVSCEVQSSELHEDQSHSYYDLERQLQSWRDGELSFHVQCEHTL